MECKCGGYMQDRQVKMGDSIIFYQRCPSCGRNTFNDVFKKVYGVDPTEHVTEAIRKEKEND